MTLAKLSGMHRNRSFLSDSNIVTASFTSDDSGAGVGFRALYSSWKEAPIEHLPERGGVVHSIGYPNFAPSFTLQRFLIQCSIEEDIHLNVSGASAMTLPLPRTARRRKQSPSYVNACLSFPEWAWSSPWCVSLFSPSSSLSCWSAVAREFVVRRSEGRKVA